MKIKVIILLMTVLVLVGNGFLAMYPSALAGSVPLDRTEISITEFTLTKSDGTIPSGGFYTSDTLKLNIAWDASAYGNQLK